MGFSSFPGRKVCEKQHRPALRISPSKRAGAKMSGVGHFLFNFHAALGAHTVFKAKLL